jgi:hypothetical protein
MIFRANSQTLLISILDCLIKTLDLNFNASTSILSHLFYKKSVKNSKFTENPSIFS